MTCKDYLHDESVVSFHRNKYVFLVNMAAEKKSVELKHSQPAEIIYCSKPSETENVSIKFEESSLKVQLPVRTAIVLEKERIN